MSGDQKDALCFQILKAFLSLQNYFYILSGVIAEMEDPQGEGGGGRRDSGKDGVVVHRESDGLFCILNDPKQRDGGKMTLFEEGFTFSRIFKGTGRGWGLWG
ncbi:uncharacterized protein CEXT_313981 [Caerostris extrusa]|uniref:Uncharacterized protein n=1 Tax=Caerostris extrusa TaxID=172846 RepID=A0AAV4PAZ6_CAEEX|nr:uncharacterized protein CEXT_313981 [Caerostris extrusa]